ncbi:MAG: hypothetical protein IMZ58_10815 [Thermoplasmata archaeon]|nr:hypothetical protein [Thermoplasmata archaeon]
MLCRKLKLKLNNLEVGTTPMLLPSVSSKINLDVAKTLETISIIVDGPLLISAYDFYHSNIPPISFPDLIFLDSGGYECNKDQEISDIGLYKPKHKKWKKRTYQKVIRKWSSKIPTVLISYDHPSIRLPISKQVEKANQIFKEKNNFLKEILIKPETKNSTEIQPERIIENLESFCSFNIIGFTEKELGKSVFSRMICIAKIRMAMAERHIEIPIHIFGSLDTVTTPLYYLSGADIFDGLSWLRYIFINDNTLYLDSYGPKCYGIDEKIDEMWIKTVDSNYKYLRQLKLTLEKLCSDEDFSVFGSSADFFRNAYDRLLREQGGD